MERRRETSRFATDVSLGDLPSRARDMAQGTSESLPWEKGTRRGDLTRSGNVHWGWRRIVRYWIRTIKEEKDLDEGSVRSARWNDKEQGIVVHYISGVLSMDEEARRRSSEIWCRKSLPTFSPNSGKKSAESFVTDPRTVECDDLKDVVSFLQSK